MEWDKKSYMGEVLSRNTDMNWALFRRTSAHWRWSAGPLLERQFGQGLDVSGLGAGVVGGVSKRRCSESHVAWVSASLRHPCGTPCASLAALSANWGNRRQMDDRYVHPSLTGLRKRLSNIGSDATSDSHRPKLPTSSKVG